MKKVFFSKNLNPDKWGDDYECLTLFLIPNKWWKYSEWKLAWSLRAEMLKRLMMSYKCYDTLR